MNLSKENKIKVNELNRKILENFTKFNKYLKYQKKKLLASNLNAKKAKENIN